MCIMNQEAVTRYAMLSPEYPEPQPITAPHNAHEAAAYLTPEQRLGMIAEILADIALRITRDSHENRNL